MPLPVSCMRVVIVGKFCAIEPFPCPPSLSGTGNGFFFRAHDGPRQEKFPRARVNFPRFPHSFPQFHNAMWKSSLERPALTEKSRGGGCNRVADVVQCRYLRGAWARIARRTARKSRHGPQYNRKSRRNAAEERIPHGVEAVPVWRRRVCKWLKAGII